MAASVRVEDDAFCDQRIALLGTIAGYNGFEALGRLVHLWRVCTNRGEYVVSEAQVIACLGPKGIESIVQADLGERVANGIRVKGTAGRIEWLRSKREAGRKGGLAKSESARGVLEQNVADAKQTPSESYPPTPVLTLTLTPTLVPSPAVAPSVDGDQPTKPEKPKKEKPTFTIPTVEEVAAYCRERGNEIDAERFVDFYSAKGWMIGKNKIKDWKACVRTWEKSEQPKGKEPEAPIKQSVLSKFECDHGTYDPTGRIPFQYNTRLCRNLECPACKPKREAQQ